MASRGTTHIEWLRDRSWVDELLILGRNQRCRRLFAVLRRHVRGNVLDVGGSDFVRTAMNQGVAFDAWTVIEKRSERLFGLNETNAVPSPTLKLVIGDGCDMRSVFADATFDTVLNIHVLEHVLDPIGMVRECARVLKPGGRAVFLIPQTASVHHAPEVFYNFTRFWVERAMPLGGLEIVEIHALGGLWTSLASMSFFFFFEALRVPGYTYSQARRNLWFFLLFPFMVLYALLTIVVGVCFGIGDLAEAANNHLVVVRKPST